MQKWSQHVYVAETSPLAVTCHQHTNTRLQFVCAAGEPAPIATFNQHTDYVNCLAAAKSTPIVASAGLRAEVFLWDVQKAMRINEQVTSCLTASHSAQQCILCTTHLCLLPSSVPELRSDAPKQLPHNMLAASQCLVILCMENRPMCIALWHNLILADWCTVWLIRSKAL